MRTRGHTPASVLDWAVCIIGLVLGCSTARWERIAAEHRDEATDRLVPSLRDRIDHRLPGKQGGLIPACNRANQ
jgi:hypothetical protein